MQIFYHHIGKEIYVFARFSPADIKFHYKEVILF